MSAGSVVGHLPSTEEAMRVIELHAQAPRGVASIPLPAVCGGLGENVTEAQLREEFAPFGVIADAIAMSDRGTPKSSVCGVLPFYAELGVEAGAVLTDNDREFCGKPESHPYELMLTMKGIEHRTTRVRSPRTNGFVERMNRALLDKCFRIQGLKNWPRVGRVPNAVMRLWWRTQRRRSQTMRIGFRRMHLHAQRSLTRPRVLHPYPLVRPGVITRGKSRMR